MLAVIRLDGGNVSEFDLHDNPLRVKVTGVFYQLKRYQPLPNLVTVW
jgi:hypothetical protein